MSDGADGGTNSGADDAAGGGVDFDALSRRMMASGGAREDLDAIYGHTFALPAWFFIARGELPEVHPYVASNAAVAEGRPMIRAFTDTDRLYRFAQENGLTDAAGSASILSIPTAGAVEYLEGFIEDGAYGLWFNSDNGSDGFFAPLQQLRPIRDHLARIGWAPAAG